MTAARKMMLLISLISSAFVSHVSSQQHTVEHPLLFEDEQWTQALNYTANLPAPVEILRTFTATWTPLVSVGDRAVSVLEPVPVAHVSHVKTVTVFTSQVRRVTANRVRSFSRLIVKTLREGSSESPAPNSGDTGALQTAMKLRQGRTANETEGGATSVLITSTTSSGRTSSQHVVGTVVEVLPLRTPPVTVNTSGINTEAADVRVVLLNSQTSSEGITAKSTQNIHQTLPMALEEEVLGDGKRKLPNGQHDPVPVQEASFGTDDFTTQIPDSTDRLENSAISDSQAVISDDPGAPLMNPKTGVGHTFLPDNPSVNNDVGEGSGVFFSFTDAEITHDSSQANGLYGIPDDTQPSELPRSMALAGKSDVVSFGVGEEEDSFLTTMPESAERTTPKLVTPGQTTVRNVWNSSGKLKGGTEYVPEKTQKIATIRDYAVDLERGEPGSVDVIRPTIFELPPTDITPVSLSDHAASPDIPANTGFINTTSAQSLLPESSSQLSHISRISPDPSRDVSSPVLLSITATEATATDVRETVTCLPSDNQKTGAKDLAATRPSFSPGASVSSVDRHPPSETRQRWLWALIPLLLLMLVAVAFSWCLLRRRRRKLDISGSSGGGGDGASCSSPWSQPAQPVLHASVRPAFDPDESLAPPPPSYRQHQDVAAASVPCVSLELGETPRSSRQLSGTGVSTESSRRSLESVLTVCEAV